MPAMKTQDWFRRTEAVLYEMKTMNAGIAKLEKRTDECSKALLLEKLTLKSELEESINQLIPADQRFITDYYVLGVTQVAMSLSYGLAQATWYRKRNMLVKKIAQYMGYV